MDVSALHRLLVTIHTALGKAGLMDHVSNALLTVFTQTLDNLKTFDPKSHVGQSSEGGLNS